MSKADSKFVCESWSLETFEVVVGCVRLVLVIVAAATRTPGDWCRSPPPCGTRLPPLPPWNWAARSATAQKERHHGSQTLWYGRYHSSGLQWGTGYCKVYDNVINSYMMHSWRCGTPSLCAIIIFCLQSERVTSYLVRRCMVSRSTTWLSLVVIAQSVCKLFKSQILWREQMTVYASHPIEA